MDWDTTERQQRVDVFDVTTGALLDTRLIGSYQGGQYLVWSLRGHVRLRFTRLAGWNAVLSGVFFGATSGSAGATAQFVVVDETTHGDWQGTYGADGYAIVGDVTSLPAYATMTPSGHASYTWAASTSDVRGLQRASGPGRLAATWYADAWDLDINLTDGLTHQVGFYVVDWDTTARQQRVDVVDAVTGIVLDSRSLGSYQGGQFLVWNLSGHVQLRFTLLAGANAVLSGVFFDAPAGDMGPLDHDPAVKPPSQRPESP